MFNLRSFLIYVGFFLVSSLIGNVIEIAQPFGSWNHTWVFSVLFLGGYLASDFEHNRKEKNKL